MGLQLPQTQHLCDVGTGAPGGHPIQLEVDLTGKQQATVIQTDIDGIGFTGTVGTLDLELGFGNRSFQIGCQLNQPASALFCRQLHHTSQGFRAQIDGHGQPYSLAHGSTGILGKAVRQYLLIPGRCHQFNITGTTQVDLAVRAQRLQLR